LNMSTIPPSQPIVITYENGDTLVHTDAHPFCDDPTCPCYDDAPTMKLLASRIPRYRALRRLRLIKPRKQE
jgi:hypothetical protein